MEPLYEKDPAKARKKGFKETSGYILILGSFYRGPLLITGFHLLYLFSTLFILMYTTYLSYEDTGVFVEALHFTVMIVNTTVAAICGLWNRNGFDRMFEIVGSDFFYYGNTFDAISFNNMVDKWRYSGKKRKYNASTLFKRIICFIAVTHGIVRPLFDWLTGKFEGVKTSDGIVRTLPIALWFPFDPNSNAHFIGAHIYEYYATILVVTSILCLELPLISFTEELCSEFELLGKGLVLFDQRAKSLYKILYGKEPKENDRKLEECIKECLRDSVKHHLLLISFFSYLRRLQFFPLLSGMLAATLLLCLSGFLFTDDTVSISVKVNFFIFIFGELVYTFIFCWYGQRIQKASCLPSEALYNSNWFKHYKTIKYYMVIINACTKKPLMLSAGGFVSVSLSTFTDVCRTAYSYFSLLKAVSN